MPKLGDLLFSCFRRQASDHGDSQKTKANSRANTPNEKKSPVARMVDFIRSLTERLLRCFRSSDRVPSANTGENPSVINPDLHQSLNSVRSQQPPATPAHSSNPPPNLIRQQSSFSSFPRRDIQEVQAQHSNAAPAEAIMPSPVMQQALNTRPQKPHDVSIATGVVPEDMHTSSEDLSLSKSPPSAQPSQDGQSSPSISPTLLTATVKKQEQTTSNLANQAAAQRAPASATVNAESHSAAIAKDSNAAADTLILSSSANTIIQHASPSLAARYRELTPSPTPRIQEDVSLTRDALDTDTPANDASSTPDNDASSTPDFQRSLDHRSEGLTQGLEMAKIPEMGSEPVSSSFATLQDKKLIPDHASAEAQRLEQPNRERSPAVSAEDLTQTPDRLATAATACGTPMTQQASAFAIQNLGARSKISSPFYHDFQLNNAGSRASAFDQTQQQTIGAAEPVAMDKSQRIRVAPESVQQEVEIAQRLREESSEFEAFYKKLLEWRDEQCRVVYQNRKTIFAIWQQFLKLAKNQEKHTLDFKDIESVEFVQSLPDVFDDLFFVHVHTVDLTNLTTLSKYPQSLLQSQHIKNLSLHTLPSQEEQEQMLLVGLKELSIVTPVNQWHFQPQAFPEIKGIKFRTASADHQLSLALTPFSCLEDIDLSGSIFPENSKSHLGNINFPQTTRVLNLENCDLRAIPADIGTRLPNLRDLYLSNNEIGLQSLRPGLVNGPALKRVVLENNKHDFKPKGLDNNIFVFDSGLKSPSEISRAWCSTEQIEIDHPHLEALLNHLINKIRKKALNDPNKILSYGSFINQLYIILDSNHAEFRDVQQRLSDNLKIEAECMIDTYFHHKSVVSVVDYITDLVLYDPKAHQEDYGLFHPYILISKDGKSAIFMRSHVYPHFINPLNCPGKEKPALEDSFMHFHIRDDFSIEDDMTANQEMRSGNLKAVGKQSPMLEIAMRRALDSMHSITYEKFLNVLDFSDPAVKDARVGGKLFIELFREAAIHKDYGVKLTKPGQANVLAQVLSKHWRQENQDDQWAFTLNPDFVKKAQEAYQVNASQKKEFSFFLVMYFIHLGSAHQFGTEEDSPFPLRLIAAAAYKDFRQTYPGYLPNFSSDPTEDWFNRITGQEDTMECLALVFGEMYSFAAKKPGMKAIIDQWMPEAWQEDSPATEDFEVLATEDSETEEWELLETEDSETEDWEIVNSL